MHRLARREVREFHEAGFVVVPRVFAPHEVARMRAAFDRLERAAYRLGHSGMHRGSQFVLDADPDGGNDRPVRIRRIVWCGAAEPVLDTFGRDPRLLRMAARLLGSRTMNQLINQAHFKLPGDGVEFPWHQDSVHRRFGRGEWEDLNGRGSYVQTVTAIDDLTADNGPLRFLRGSGVAGHVEPAADGSYPAERIDLQDEAVPEVAAGGVILFGPYTVHGSLPNRSKKPRRVFVNGFAYPGANSRCYPGQGAGRLLELA